MSEKGKGSGRGRAALGGFVLGAATVLLIVWLYGPPGRGGAPAPPAPVIPPPPAVTPGTGPGTEAPAPVSPGVPPATNPPVTSSEAPPLPPANPADPGNRRPYSAPGRIEDLAARRLTIPVQGIAVGQLQNTFDDARSEGRVHEAIDIMAPRGTPVLAVEEGKVVKLFQSDKGGITIYQFDPSETFCYYYAHLDRYAGGIQEGALVHRGQVIGYVGSTGNASPDGPHLHFAIFRLGPEKQWWKGTALNPYPALHGP
ncbi:MAG TPA: M23 family metallopeptidase [Thermoanaerobaculia bacterium]|jgi:murein DD-endopeptidase MepM/ murein hydrolase activator NlpD|nr:M23 family metallopeptidase [Thermoanaerobaculia bacterium]